MRTRFLCIDYFNPFPNQTLDFLHLPLPRQLPPPPPSPNLLASVSPFDISVEFDPFPIDHALSKFYSDVIPEFILVQDRDCSAHSEEKSEHSFDDKEDFWTELAEFEVPQLDIPLENSCFFEKKMELFSEILEADGNLGTIEADLTFHCPAGVLESIYLVDDIRMEQKPWLLENSSPVQDQVDSSDFTFPLLEVDEISLGISDGVCIEDEVFLLDKIETLSCVRGGEIVDDSRELLSSLDIDILEYIAGPSLSKQSFRDPIQGSKSWLEMDVISIIEISNLGGNQVYQEETPDDHFNPVGSFKFKFEEYKFLNYNPYQIEDVFYNLASVSESDTSEEMILEDLVGADFNELIVSHELTLMDESFKSLPVPILSAYGNKSSHYELVEELLISLEPLPSSTSDNIYLDWRLLEGDYRNNEKYSSCWKQVFGIDKFSIDPETSIDGMVIFNFALNSDTPIVSNVADDKENVDLQSIGISTAGFCASGSTTSRLNLDDCRKSGCQEISSDSNAERVSSVLRSISPFDNLKFFLNPREAAGGKSAKPSSEALGVEKSNGKVTKTAVLAVPSLEQIAPRATATVPAPPQQCDINLHKVYLSGCVLELMDNFQKNYLAILKGNLLAKIQQSSLATNDTALLSLPKSTLMGWIKDVNDNPKCVADSENTTIALVTLCAIKQLAWYLCYFGIHATYIYLKQLCQTLDVLENKLSFLRTSIEDVYAKAKSDITLSHPSLSIIKSVLQSQKNNGGMKMLIVADQVFWFSLKTLLNSLNISYCDQQSLYTGKSHTQCCSDIEFPEAVEHLDCLLVSTEHISPPFRFDRFGIILEYGGSGSSSRVSTILPKPLCFPGLHFFKLELEESKAIKAFCEGVGIPCGTSSPTELEKLLNFVPLVEKYCMGSSSHEDETLTMEAEEIFKNVPSVPAADEPERIPSNISPFPGTVIIVNTQTLDKEMIISRRSSYQKILAMEKKGAQVVERDLKYPVDLIISAAMCLVWYDRENIRRKATSSDESSSLPWCIENIAANILTSLSFSFSCCILVFEGESDYLSSVMELSDELYAAAFSLSMKLQLFYSHSSELTDEIILNCIESTTKLTKHIYPKMPESETLAESFLTSFPSLNPLSAHAILSSGGTPVEFLEWSHERRLRAIQKYHVSDEGLRLFSDVCKYGEKEDSRSAMTDCSSSVSSAPESRSRHWKPESAEKVQHSNSPHKIDIPMDELFDFEQLKHFDDDLNQQKVLKSHDNWMLGDDVDFLEIQGPGNFGSDIEFHQKQGTRAADLAPLMKVSKHADSQLPRTSTSYEMKKRSWPFDEDILGPEDANCASSMDNFNFNFNKKSRNLEDVTGGVIDFSDVFPIIDDFPSVTKSKDVQSLMLETDKYTSTGNSRVDRRLSFSGAQFPTFPTSAEISSNCDVWGNIDETRQCPNEHTNLDFRNKFPPNTQVELIEEYPDQRKATYIPSQSAHQRHIQQQSGSVLANAVLSAQPQEGSPWTMEFLKRIREKSRLRQQALPPNMSPPFSPFREAKGIKRKSPSVLDSFSYQGGSKRIINKLNGQKRQIKSLHPPALARQEKMAPPSLSALTPLDKKSRRTLSFSRGGGSSQSKLIWCNRDANNMDRRFYD